VGETAVLVAQDASLRKLTLDEFDRAVGRPVVNDDDVELTGAGVRKDRLEARRQPSGTVERDDDDGEIGDADCLAEDLAKVSYPHG
jgi:hypothetical protein